LVGTNLEKSLLMAQTTINIVDALKPGDRVVILWHDACRVTNDPDVRSIYFSTPKETQGTVFDCLPDPQFENVFYLIIWGETTGGRPDYYDAIPLNWIARITPLAPVPVKFPMMAMRVLPVGNQQTVKRVMVYAGGQLVEDTNDVSKLTMRYTREGRVMKLVEEIHKIIT
jgi:hypothetical protein